MTSTFTANLNLQLQGTGDNSGTWGSILNANVISLVDQALGSTYAANVAGSSDVTLSTANAGNLIHNLTGVLTGNINYIFPAAAGRFLIIKNGTSGAFSVTVKPSGGTGVVVTQGATQFIYIDSSNTTAYQPVSAAGIGALVAANNLSDLANASTARTNLGLGSAAVLASSAVAQTANNLSDLNSASTARTNLGLGTAATQSTGTFLQVANNLSDLGTLATALTNLGFSTTLSTQYSVTIPGGLIIKAGVISSIAPAGTNSPTFDVAFPTECKGAVAMPTAPGSSGGASMAVTAYSTTGITVANNINATSNNIPWLAWGK